jgi:hypothetical protein
MEENSMKMAWLLLICISWIGCATGSRTAVTPSTAPVLADRHDERYRERIDQLDAKIAILKRQMARVEESTVELLEGFRDLKKSMVGLKHPNLAPSTVTTEPIPKKEEVRLPSLPVLAGKNKPWSQQDRTMAAESMSPLK